MSPEPKLLQSSAYLLMSLVLLPTDDVTPSEPRVLRL